MCCALTRAIEHRVYYRTQYLDLLDRERIMCDADWKQYIQENTDKQSELMKASFPWTLMLTSFLTREQNANLVNHWLMLYEKAKECERRLVSSKREVE